MKVLLIFILLAIAAPTDAQNIGVWPTSNEVISSTFGPRLKFSDKNRLDFHRGIDIPGNLRDDIYSIHNGIVDNVFNEGSSTFPNGGNVVRIKHNGINGVYYSLYLHLSSILVVKDQTVIKGQKIGTLGQTGDTTFNHLHLEILEGTPCSLESQLKGLCSLTATGKDPHKNPLNYIYVANSVAPSIEVLGESPLSIRISVSAREVDFNRIEVVSNKGVLRVLDFNERTGFDATSLERLDQKTTPDNITISPAPFTSSIFNNNGLYRIDFTFNEFNSYKSITVSDIWKNVRAVKQRNVPPIFPALPAIYDLLR